MRPEDYQGFKKFHSVLGEDGIRTRIIEFAPFQEIEKPILFIPGWVTRLEVMYEVIKILLAEGFPVYYFESRDKKSSEIPPHLLKPETFRIEQQVQDLEKAIHYFSFKEGTYYLFSSSYGSILATQMLSKVREKKTPFPAKIVLMVPTLEIKFNWWQKALIRMPKILEGPAVSLVEWYMKRKYANPQEPEEHYKFKAQLYEFELHKVQLTAIALDKYGAKISGFQTKLRKTLVVAASLDLLHPIEDVRILADRLDAVFLDLLSNKFTHGELGGRVISHFFKKEDFDPATIMEQNPEFQKMRRNSTGI